jgi:hypothetical protein
VADKSITGISLNDVRELINEKNIGEDAADAVGKLLGLVIALAPAVGGPGLLLLWTLIEPKNELIEAIKYAARKFSRSKPKDYLDRAERMAAANCLLVYAAYFDTLRQHWPAIIQNLGITPDEAKETLSAVAELAPASSSPHDSIADLAIAIPHRHNESYFGQSRIRPFVIPDNEKLLELARQPLLLLMLAIYDSLGNELSSQPDIDQTLLYDRLLRRFIERELSKGKAGREFAALPDAARAAAIDWEMGRLGVAAVGMFNRQDLKIHREELNADLHYFGAEKAAAADGRVLAEADLLLGSFFFIHESRSKLQEEATGPGDRQAAFEFLHNTFGEFLTADFILRRAAEEARTVCRLSGDALLSDTRQRHLTMLREDWFGCLVHTALHTRPVILDMIREWSRHRLDNRQSSRADMLAAFDAIVAAQLRAVLNDMTIPDPAPKQRSLSPYDPLPRRGHLAIYSLNLVLLRAYLGDEEYVLDETALGNHPDSCRPWDSLTNLWRSWFTLEALSALADMVTATRCDESIEIVPHMSGLTPAIGSPLRNLYRAAVALADNLTAASAGLDVAPATNMPQGVFQELWRRVGSAAPELNIVADVLALKMFAKNGDELRVTDNTTQVANPGFSLDGNAAKEIWVDFADVAARLTHTPRQRRQVTVKQNYLEDLEGYSGDRNVI